MNHFEGGAINCLQVKKYQDVWITSGPLWLPVEEPPKEENTNDQSDKLVDCSTDENVTTETKKKRKVRPPRPPARRMTYPVIGPNQVSVPTHLYKVHCRFNLVEFQLCAGDCGV